MTKMSFLFDAPQLLAQQAPAQPGGLGGQWMLIGYVLLFGAMYFFMIAPQRKKQKEHQKMLDSLTTGDQVITAGGIYGEITNKKDDRFVIRIGDNTKVEVGKGFVQTVVKKADAGK